MDYLGPISPKCEITRAAYVLLVVDYFSRFVWAKAYISANQEAVHDFWIDTLVSIFGFPGDLYTDNGSHFIGSETVSLFESHGTHVSQAPISHPSSVGLIERNVQIVLAQIRRWVYERGPQAKHCWGRAIPQIMLSINGRLLRIHGFTPAEILLGYNPEWRVSRGSDEGPSSEVIDVATPKEDLEYWEERRRELRNQTTLALTNHHTRLQANATSAWTPPKVGDLVLVRDMQKEKQHGRKLDPSWVGPRLLMRLTGSGVSGYVQEMYDDKVKRYHLDDLKVYCRRERTATAATVIDRAAMMYTGFPGQRAVDLDSPAYFT